MIIYIVIKAREWCDDFDGYTILDVYEREQDAIQRCDKEELEIPKPGYGAQYRIEIIARKIA